MLETGFHARVIGGGHERAVAAHQRVVDIRVEERAENRRPDDEQRCHRQHTHHQPERPLVDGEPRREIGDHRQFACPYEVAERAAPAVWREQKREACEDQEQAQRELGKRRSFAGFVALLEQPGKRGGRDEDVAPLRVLVQPWEGRERAPWKEGESAQVEQQGER